MGISYVMWVYDDGIRQAERSEEQRNKIQSALGEAVLKVCLKPDYESTEQGFERVTWSQVNNFGNCVNLVDEVHSNDLGVYLWGSNCLAKIQDLDDKDLVTAKQIIDDEMARRNKSE